MVDIHGWMMDRWVAIGECIHVCIDGEMNGYRWI